MDDLKRTSLYMFHPDLMKQLRHQDVDEALNVAHVELGAASSGSASSWGSALDLAETPGGKTPRNGSGPGHMKSEMVGERGEHRGYGCFLK